MLFNIFLKRFPREASTLTTTIQPIVVYVSSQFCCKRFPDLLERFSIFYFFKPFLNFIQFCFHCFSFCFQFWYNLP